MKYVYLLGIVATVFFGVPAFYQGRILDGIVNVLGFVAFVYLAHGEFKQDRRNHEGEPCPVCGEVGHEVRQIHGQRVVICPKASDHPMGPIFYT